MSQNELSHYGVIGMKWGVRRYQNSDGSYTKAGLARYRKAESEYDQAHAKKKKEAQYVNGAQYKGETKVRKEQKKLRNKHYAEYKNHRLDEREAGEKMRKAYKELPKAASADRGEALIKNGYNHKKQQASNIALIGTAAALSVGAKYLSSVTGQTARGYKVAKGLSTASKIAAGGAFLNQLQITDNYNDMKNYKEMQSDKKTTNPYNRTPMDEKHHASQPVGHVPTIDELRKKNHHGI